MRCGHAYLHERNPSSVADPKGRWLQNYLGETEEKLTYKLERNPWLTEATPHNRPW